MTRIALAPLASNRQFNGKVSGAVVIVALVAILLMALSAAALMRTVSASIALTGNLGFAQAAVAASDVAVERAVNALFESRTIADPTRNDTTQGYFASRQAGQNPRGVPLALQALAQYPSDAPVIDAGEGNALRYVIERMCLGPGTAAPANCTLTPTSEPPLAVAGEAVIEPPSTPMYRQSIRIDGPGGTVQFVQAWLADIPGRRRFAWRVLAD